MGVDGLLLCLSDGLDPSGCATLRFASREQDDALARGELRSGGSPFRGRDVPLRYLRREGDDDRRAAGAHHRTETYSSASSTDRAWGDSYRGSLAASLPPQARSLSPPFPRVSDGRRGIVFAGRRLSACTSAGRATDGLSPRARSYGARLLGYFAPHGLT